LCNLWNDNLQRPELISTDDWEINHRYNRMKAVTARKNGAKSLAAQYIPEHRKI